MIIRFFKAWPVVFLLSFLMPFSSWSEEVKGSTEPAELLSAIEDYRFSDFDTAISKLTKLKEIYPDNLRLLKYLGLSYEESEQNRSAMKTYREWLSKSSQIYGPESRFAHLGIANIAMKNKQDDIAVKQLKGWLTYHPQDRTTQLVYGNLLMRTKNYAAAEVVWQGLVSDPASSANQKAAGYYYLAWMAYLHGDMSTAKEQAALSLDADSDGDYAKPSQQLLAMKAVSRFAASVSVEGFYTDNVELLPDYVPGTGKDNKDTATQAGLMLSYNFPGILMAYAYQGTSYAKRSDFDIAVHALSVTWRNEAWSIAPRYEYVQLSTAYLYDAAGVDVTWAYQDWSVGYGGMYKQFSDSFSTDSTVPPSDLRRLGGVTNSLTVTNAGGEEGFYHSVSFGLTDEATKGDATHDKTDSYQQVLMAASLSQQFDQIGVAVSGSAYLRKYGKADALANGLVRQDENVQLATSVSWRPGQSNHQLALNIGWQRNTSNYNDANKPTLAKEYEAVRTGIAWNYRW